MSTCGTRTLRWLLGTCIAASMMWFTSDTAMAAQTVGIKEADIFLIPAPVARVIRVVDVMTLANASNAAADFVFTLPAGASEASIDEPAHAISQVGGGKITARQLLKAGGQTTVSVSYRLPYQIDQGQQLSLHTEYPIYTAKLYLPVGGFALSAEGLLASTQTVNVQGTQFRVFTRLGIPANDDWGLSLQALPVGNTADPTAGMKVIGVSSSSTGNTLQAVGNLLMAAFILVIGLISIRSTQWGRGSRTPKSPEDALLDAWQTTELQYANGLLDPLTYERRRETYKQKLLELRRRP